MEHEAYETAMPQAHTIIFSIPMAKQCYCSNNIFLLKKNNNKKKICEIVPNLLEDLSHQGRACAATSKKTGRVKGRCLLTAEWSARWDAAN